MIIAWNYVQARIRHQVSSWTAVVMKRPKKSEKTAWEEPSFQREEEVSHRANSLLKGVNYV